MGATSVDSFNGGATCASARVTDVYIEGGRKWVRYQWWSCKRGKSCGGGTTLTCRNASGNWEAQG